MKQTCKLLLTLMALAVCGCLSPRPEGSAKLESYINPGYDAKSIKRVAILPISNSRLSAVNSAEVSSSFAKAVSRRNPALVIMAGEDAVARLNEAHKADIWSDFLRNYSVGGIPNTQVIKDVAGILNVDGIIQGTIIDIKQEDSNGFSYPMTRVVLRYTMFSALDGSILWEITGEGSIQPYAYKAAPIFEALRLANDKILESLPL